MLGIKLPMKLVYLPEYSLYTTTAYIVSKEVEGPMCKFEKMAQFGADGILKIVLTFNCNIVN